MERLEVAALAAISIQRRLLMQMLYDSDAFVVVQIQANAALRDATGRTRPRMVHGFEIVDKRSGKQVYLDGSWAELFQQRLNAWQETAPTQEEVEDTLEGYAGLAHTPVALH
jgi:hypothetical protein